MILLPVDLLPQCNRPIAGGETIMKWPFIVLTVKVKRPLPSCKTQLFMHRCACVCVSVCGYRFFIWQKACRQTIDLKDHTDVFANRSNLPITIMITFHL